MVSVVAAALGLFGAGASADAALVVTLQPTITAPQGSSNNFFDVFLSNTGPTSFNIVGYQVKLDIGNTLAAFTGTVTEATSLPASQYLFAGPANSGISPTPLTPQSLLYSDNVATAADAATVGPGNVFGLGRVFFNVSPAAPLASLIPVTVDPSQTSFLLSDFATTVTPTAVNSDILVTAPAAVPEPSSFLLLLAAGGVGFAVRRRRRTAETAAAA